jgi:hypothetical protein
MNLDPLEENKDTQIWKALEHAHLKEFIQNLPQNLEYDCGEGGQNRNFIIYILICYFSCIFKRGCRCHDCMVVGFTTL